MMTKSKNHPEGLSPEDMDRTHHAAFTQGRPWSAAEFDALLDSPFTYAVGDPRSFALGRVVAGEAELLTIATHPDHQRLGLAGKVLKNWQDAAMARNATEGFLEVAADNQIARTLYLSYGFAESGRRRGYYPRKNTSAVDAVLMSVDLRKAQTAE
ncbi:GNAT family N-acetyltransferase [Phaeobacter sp. C3_T13_0]|uniref:GNAT family N-acetyltransferase n=1 Tax=Phaeobacter cretensis TaxID=3342641 RepID=UPI0039BC843F